MADETQVNGNETATVTPAKSKTEYEKVTMNDGREVQFAGKRQLNKSVIVNEETGDVMVRFDFRNGACPAISLSEVPTRTKLELAGHGISQKVGDEGAGVEKVEDFVLGVEEMIARLKKGEWTAARAAGDSFSGASIVIRAIVEATGKSVEAVKAFLDGKLEAAKARNEKLSRADLYASFRNPTSRTGAIIERLEREERSKNVKADANALLSEIGETA